MAKLEFLCCCFRLDQLCAQVLVNLLNLSYLLIAAVNNLKDLISAAFELFLNLKFFLGKLFDHMLLIISHHLELFIQQRDLTSHLLSYNLRLQQLFFLLFDFVVHSFHQSFGGLLFFRHVSGLL